MIRHYCDSCGVELTESNRYREEMGYYNLGVLEYSKPTVTFIAEMRLALNRTHHKVQDICVSCIADAVEELSSKIRNETKQTT